MGKPIREKQVIYLSKACQTMLTQRYGKTINEGAECITE